MGPVIGAWNLLPAGTGVPAPAAVSGIRLRRSCPLHPGRGLLTWICQLAHCLFGGAELLQSVWIQSYCLL